MKLFIARHAEAIEYTTETVIDDALRFLTMEGRVKQINVAVLLKEHLSGADMILSSPLIRAVQTAEIIASGIDFSGEIILVNELKSERPIGPLIELIKNMSDYSSLILTGHEPQLGIFVKSVTGNNHPLSFSKSGICCIEYDPAADVFEFGWYFDPNKMEFVK